MGFFAKRGSDKRRLHIVRLLPAVAVIAAVAALAGAAIVRDFRQERAQASARLESVAELRATQVQAWLDRHMSFAHFLDDSTAFADLYTKWQDHGDQEAGRLLMARAIDSRHADGADSALVVAPDGRVLAREHASDTSQANPKLMKTLQQALAIGDATASSIYDRPGAKLPQRLDIVIPLLKTGRPAHGALVLRVDPQRSLFPTLANWPVPSQTAEAVLWDRVGDRIVNISEVRHRRGSLGTISEPLSTSTLPVARAARGELAAGVAIRGVDYWGQDTLFCTRPVAGTGWWLVAKIDMAEVDAPAWEHARETGLAALLALLGVGLAGRVWAQRRLVREARQERVEQRERLRALALLEAIARSASDAIYAKDLEGRYVFCNRAAADVIGRPAEDVLGRTNEDLFDPETAAELTQADLLAALGELPANQEEVIRKPHGTFQFLATKQPLVDAQGSLLGILGVSRDVTSMREVQRALRASEEQYKAVFSALNEGIIVCDSEGRIVSSNPAADRITGSTIPAGLSREASIAKWRPLRPDGTPMPAEERPLSRVLAGAGAQHDVVMRGLDASGMDKVLLVNALPLFDPDTGAMRGVVTTLIDVTVQHRMESDLRRHRDALETQVAQRTHELVQANDSLTHTNEALARSRDEAETANRAKSAFVANMSHEIRTPLNGILGLAYLLARDPRDALQRERLGKIGDAGQHLLRIINDVLDLSKIEAGKLTLEDADFSLDNLLSTACDMVVERAQAKGLELVLDTDHLPRQLRGDPTRLAQMLLNLLSNAVKFTDTGWVRLKGELLDERDGRVQVRFAVQDTGPGIAQAAQAQLFGAFEQGDNTTTRRFGGTGLGLSLTRNLAAAMGGEVGLVSQPGAGSTFWFTAWLAHAARVDDAATLAPMKAMRILLVDDLPEAAAVIASYLATMGMLVDVQPGGEAAVQRVEAEMAQGRPYDLMLVDSSTLCDDGSPTLVRLHGLMGDGMPPCVLLASSAASLLAGDRMFGVKVDAVLDKPVTASALHDVVARILFRQGGARAGAAIVRDASEDVVREHHAGQCVLLVEDNVVNRLIERELLTHAGLVVEQAENGAIALELAASQHWDLILMDMQMPVMDGLDAARAIRERGDTLVPIVAMTANAFVEDRIACLEAGMNDHIAKPVNPAALYAILMRWLPTQRR